MNDQYIFDVAEWLLYNAEDINNKLNPVITRWKKARDSLSGESPTFIMKYNADIKYKYEDSVYKEAHQHFKDLSAWDIRIAFEDERVRIILNKYYKLGDL